MRFACAVLITLALTGAFADPDGLLLYAPFDGSPDAAIARGDAHNPDGLGLSFTEGIRGKAVVLRNDCRFAVAGNFDASEGTVALWMRPHWSAGDPSTHYVFCLYGRRDLHHSWAVNRWNITCGGGQCRFTIFSQTESKTFSASASIGHWKPEEWHHIAATWASVNSGEANGEMRLYLDGVLLGSLTGKQIDVGPTDTVMAIGRDQDASPDYADAELDDLFIYGRALRADEIAAGVAAVRRGEPYAVSAAADAPREVAGWWNTAWPFRAEVIVPASDDPRQDASVQCPLRVGADVAALGIPGSPNMGSVRIVTEGGEAIPCRIEEGFVAWQEPGQTPAGAERRFCLYFGLDRYEIAAPLWGTRRVLDISPEPFPMQLWKDYATVTYGKPWDFDDGTFSGIDQWGNKPECLFNKKVEDGILSMDVHEDPWFIWGDMWGQVDTANQKVAIDLDKFPVLEMKVRQSVDRAEWEIYGRPGTSDRLLHFDFPVRGTGWQRISIDLKKDARWGGVLSAFRVDPTRYVDAHVEIDWVRLLATMPVEHGRVETIGEPSGVAARLELTVPETTIPAGAVQDVVVTVRDAAGKPVSGQPLVVELTDESGGSLAAAGVQRSLALGPKVRRGLTDESGCLAVKHVANTRAAEAADAIVARVEFATTPEARVRVNTVAGPPHHYRVEPAKVVTIKAGDLPVGVSAQLVDEFDNPVPGRRKLTWATDGGATLTDAADAFTGDGSAKATWRGDESKRWVYGVRVQDDEGLSGESGAICLLPSKPRTDPIVLGPNAYFRKGPDGPAWLPLGGFYANWVGLPRDGEEGRQVLSFVEATEEQLAHWLEFLASQGVTAMRFMLRAHTPRGMEPMDIIGRVNMPLFAKVLRYMDLARKHDIRFMLTIHEDYTKPAYHNQRALETFCIPRYEREDLDALPPFQRRFIRDRKLIGLIEEKYTDPDVIACQDQYTRQLVGLLRDNPQLFAWEFENEMVNCPREWANHAAAVIRSADPVTPICASHGGGGIHTADPLWWTHNTDVDFYTYHLYSHLGSTSPEIDYGAAVDVLTCYGRMAGVCMLGESSGDEFSRYPKDRDADRRYIMRDIIWFSLVNGNPGCFFWNARGHEVAQFRLANKIASQLDWRDWKRARPEVGIVVAHPWDDDKYYRTPQGRKDYAMMGKYAQHYLSAGVDFDFTMGAEGYGKTVTLGSFAPPAGLSRISAGEGWQIRLNAREGWGEGMAYVRNFAGVRHWEEKEGRRRANMYLRERSPAPLRVRLNLPAEEVVVAATDLDTGEERAFEVSGRGEIDLGVSEHDWALVWREG